MGKNQNSVVVLQIWVKFWWMPPLPARSQFSILTRVTELVEPVLVL